MVNRLQIIGEACRGLSEAFRARRPEVPWRAIIGMRHHLVHAYFTIDPRHHGRVRGSDHIFTRDGVEEVLDVQQGGSEAQGGEG